MLSIKLRKLREIFLTVKPIHFGNKNKILSCYYSFLTVLDLRAFIILAKESKTLNNGNNFMF